MTTRSLTLSLVCLTATACWGTDVGNPVVDVALVVHDTSVDGKTLTGAWVVYGELRVVAECQTGPELVEPGPFVVDLFTGEPPDGLRELPLAGTYCEMILPYAAAAEPVTDAPAELAGVSILLEGRRDDDTPFVVRAARTQDNLSLFSRATGGFPLGGDIGTAFIAFDASVWLGALDLDGAVVDNGEIRIEAGSNDDLLAAFQAVIDSAARLFDDDDGDGELDMQERDDPADVLAAGS